MTLQISVRHQEPIRLRLRELGLMYGSLKRRTVQQAKERMLWLENVLYHLFDALNEI